jgi:hypothetical protein
MPEYLPEYRKNALISELILLAKDIFLDPADGWYSVESRYLEDIREIVEKYTKYTTRTDDSSGGR